MSKLGDFGHPCGSILLFDSEITLVLYAGISLKKMWPRLKLFSLCFFVCEVRIVYTLITSLQTSM